MTVSGVLLIAIAALYEASKIQLPGSWQSLAALLYLILIGSIAGTLLWLNILKIFSAKKASMFFLFSPLFGLLFGWTFFGEELGFMKLSGAAIVCCAVLLQALPSPCDARSRKS